MPIQITDSTINLFKSIINNNLPAVRQAVIDQADINYVLPDMGLIYHPKLEVKNPEQQEILTIFNIEINNSSIQDLDTNNPLLLALSLEHLAIAEYLLTLPNIDITYSNRFEMNALHMLVTCAHDRGKRQFGDSFGSVAAATPEEMLQKSQAMQRILKALCDSASDLLTKKMGDNVPLSTECCSPYLTYYKEFFIDLAKRTSEQFIKTGRVNELSKINMLKEFSCCSTYDLELVKTYLSLGMAEINLGALRRVGGDQQCSIEDFNFFLSLAVQKHQSNLRDADFDCLLIQVIRKGITKEAVCDSTSNSLSNTKQKLEAIFHVGWQSLTDANKDKVRKELLDVIVRLQLDSKALEPLNPLIALFCEDPVKCDTALPDQARSSSKTLLYRPS